LPDVTACRAEGILQGKLYEVHVVYALLNLAFQTAMFTAKFIESTTMAVIAATHSVSLI
jgi:hypothetical protein